MICYTDLLLYSILFYECLPNIKHVPTILPHDIHFEILLSTFVVSKFSFAVIVCEIHYLSLMFSVIFTTNPCYKDYVIKVLLKSRISFLLCVFLFYSPLTTTFMLKMDSASRSDLITTRVDCTVYLPISFLISTLQHRPYNNDFFSCDIYSCPDLLGYFCELLYASFLKIPF